MIRWSEFIWNELWNNWVFILNGLRLWWNVLQQSLTPFLLMGNPMVLSNPQGGYAKGILYHFSCFSFVQRVFIFYYKRQKVQVNFKLSPLVEAAQKSLTCFLQMTPSSFVKPLLKMCLIFRRSLIHMRRRLISKQIDWRPPFSSINPPYKQLKKKFLEC